MSTDLTHLSANREHPENRDEHSDTLDEADGAFRLGDYDKAIEGFTHVLGARPNDPDLLCARAHALIRAEKYTEAKRDADRAIDVNRSLVAQTGFREREAIYKAFLRSGVASFHMGNFAEAKNCFQEGLKEPYSDQMALRQWVTWCEEKIERMKKAQQATATNDIATTLATTSITPSEVSQQTPQPAAIGSQQLPPSAAVAAATCKVKYDFYQTESQVVIEIRIKALKAEDVSVEFEADHLIVQVRNVNPGAYGVDRYQLDLRLAHTVVPDKCSYKVMSTKLEVRLAKVDGVRWSALEGSSAAAVAAAPAMATAATVTTSSSGGGNRPPCYPSSRPGARNWDRIEKEIEEELSQDKPEGEAALNDLFQKIYRDADEDTRKAMNKSFQESGGTVLSTNWSDIKKEKTEVKPPDGMEYKKW